jgi:hypothetical protein
VSSIGKQKKVERNKRCYTFKNGIKILEARVNKVPFEDLVTHEFPLARAQGALTAAHR